ncbi:MAG TPA: hypothetical protein VIG74_03935 [Alphaproteobacteria bacterium]
MGYFKSVFEIAKSRMGFETSIPAKLVDLVRETDENTQRLFASGGIATTEVFREALTKNLRNLTGWPDGDTVNYEAETFASLLSNFTLGIGKGPGKIHGTLEYISHTKYHGAFVKFLAKPENLPLFEEALNKAVTTAEEYCSLRKRSAQKPSSLGL